MCWIRHDSSFPFSKLFGSTEQRSSVLSRFISSDIVAMLRAILGKSQGPCIHAIGAPQLYQKSVKASSTRLFWNSGIPSLNIVFSISIYIYIYIIVAYCGIYITTNVYTDYIVIIISVAPWFSLIRGILLTSAHRWKLQVAFHRVHRSGSRPAWHGPIG